MLITVLLADDQAMARTGFRLILDSEADITVVGEADDGEHAVELTRRSPARGEASAWSLSAQKAPAAAT